MDNALIGLTGDPFEFCVEVGKVREFARVTKSENALYFNDWTPVIPPTFLVTASFWMDTSHSPTLQADLPFDRLLNGGQEFVFHGPPPRAGARLTGRGHIDAIYEKEGRRGGVMSFMEVVYEYRDEDDNLVAEARSTIIETSKVVSGE